MYAGPAGFGIHSPIDRSHSSTSESNKSLIQTSKAGEDEVINIWIILKNVSIAQNCFMFPINI